MANLHFTISPKKAKAIITKLQTSNPNIGSAKIGHEPEGKIKSKGNVTQRICKIKYGPVPNIFIIIQVVVHLEVALPF